MAGIAGGSPRLPSREGEEAVVRAWRAEDAGSITPYAANLAVARNMRDIFPHPYTRADAEAFISSCISSSEECQLCRAIAAGGRAVGGIALVALLEEPDEDGADALTAYFHLGLRGKEEAAANIQADVTEGIVRANLRRYLRELEEEDEAGE